MDVNSDTPKTIKAIAKDTVHKICSGQVSEKKSRLEILN